MKMWHMLLMGILIFIFGCSKLTESVEPVIVIGTENSLHSSNATSTSKSFKLTVTKNAAVPVLSWDTMLSSNDIASKKAFHVYTRIKGEKQFRRVAVTTNNYITLAETSKEEHYWVLKGVEGEVAESWSDIVPPIEEPLSDLGSDTPIIVDPIPPDGH